MYFRKITDKSIHLEALQRFNWSTNVAYCWLSLERGTCIDDSENPANSVAIYNTMTSTSWVLWSPCPSQLFSLTVEKIWGAWGWGYSGVLSDPPNTHTHTHTHIVAYWKVGLAGTGLPYCFQVILATPGLQLHDCEHARWALASN